MRTTYHKQGTNEKMVYPLDATNSLLAGVTISSATATHTVFPSGSAVTCTVEVATPIIYVNVPTGLPIGASYNVIEVIATCSDADQKPGHRLMIETRY